MLPPRQSRTIHVRHLALGGDAPVVVQSMAATRTQDVAATVRQVELLAAAGADLVRIAVDSKADVEALAEVRRRTPGVLLSVDLQESYRLAEHVAPHVDKLRYNPGHLHHHERSKPTAEKVAYLVEVARAHGLALRIGVNAGSVAPEYAERYPDHLEALVRSAADHCALVDELGFADYCVSIKDSDPRTVVDANVRFAALRPDVPLHLGVTEAGLPPDGVIKTRIAFEQLLARGLGDTLRVSLTVPFDDKGMEIEVARQILADVEAGRFRSVPPSFFDGLNIIACPSCSRVENEKFIELAHEVKELTRYAAEHALTIAVMGCRVNGPGETDDADLGLWCGPTHVNLKRGSAELGAYPYDQILARLKDELDALVAARSG
jgi:(E)-4-hydroxy-3-methylbut-2-enyl-diphosphate synthase